MLENFFGIYFQPKSQFHGYFSICGLGLPTTFTQLSNKEFDVPERQRNTNRTKKIHFSGFENPLSNSEYPLGCTWCKHSVHDPFRP